MLTEETTPFRDMCYDCCRPKKACFCGNIESFETKMRFIILMHPKEAKLSHIGTGRMTRVALKNSEIIVGENFDRHEKVQSYLADERYFPMVLYPGENAINLSDKTQVMIEHKRISLLFIIDGTWPCAKSMFRDSKTLHELPRLSFQSTSLSRYTIRHQPADFCLSTIESVYRIITLLEERGLETVGEKKESMLKALDSLVAFQIQCSKDPSLQRYSRKRGSYKKPEERQAAKRWEHRKICYEDRHYSNQSAKELGHD